MKSVLTVLTALLFFVGMAMAQSNANQTAQPATGNQATTSQTQTAQPANQAAQPTGTAARHHHARPSAAANANGTNAGAANGKLPQTASPLPLLGLLGMGSLGLGAASRRKRK